MRRSLYKVKPLRGQARGLAFFAALLWSVHPLLTESVVCVIQRNEVIAALFYLLTLYCCIRYTDRRQAMGDGREAEVRSDLTSGLW
ncbi:MAG: hypothetical protein KGJ37_00520, partial [Verrucomicrobiota bacterium]|nr:hypothetical protein [Verrucomicrobiota bacterium]